MQVAAVPEIPTGNDKELKIEDEKMDSQQVISHSHRSHSLILGVYSSWHGLIISIRRSWQSRKNVTGKYSLVYMVGY